MTDGKSDGAVRRTAARVLLVDDQERVLLMHERRDIGSDQTHWITPGGGIEEGETLARAAVRELYEETGLVIELDQDAQPLAHDRVRFTLAGVTYDQTNHYFIHRCRAGLKVVPAAHTAIEALVVVGHRWWKLAALEEATVDREPADIVEILRTYLIAASAPADLDSTRP